MEEEEEMICFADLSHFITDSDYCYQEFARREEEFRVQVRTLQCESISMQIFVCYEPYIIAQL